MRRTVFAVVVLLAAVLPPTAGGHSLVRSGGGLVSYTSADATSLNALTVRQTGDGVDFRDESVDGGMDPGPCTPGDLGAGGFIVQTTCPLGGVQRIRIDLGDREDRASVALGVPVTLLGGTGADALTAGDGADEVSGGDGNDVVGGGRGNDVLDGGQGVDVLDAGEGDDRVAARDGEHDAVVCGAGGDSVEADGFDTVAADCETVGRVDGAPAGAQVDVDDGRPPAVETGAATLQRLGRARVVRVYATISEPGALGASGSLEASGLALPVKRVAGRRVSVGGGGVQLRYTLTGRHWRVARKALERGRRVMVRLGVVGTDKSGRSRRVDAPAIRLVRGGSRSALGALAATTAHPEPGDVDGDEVRDEVDNCPFARNGSQVNTDLAATADPGPPPMPAGDAQGDACDDDDDADGIADAVPDNCRVVRNPLQEPGPDPRYGLACPPVDDDADGIVNSDDNCDLIGNPDQADLDGDDRGDACDRDRDGDRFDDAFDNCPTVYNLEPVDVDGDGRIDDQLDADGDGIGTACDPDEPVIVPPAAAPLRAPPAAAPDQTAPAVRMTVGRRHRLAEVRAGLVVGLRCSEACAATTELTVGRRAARRLRLGASRTVAGGSARLQGAGRTYAFVRFARSLRRGARLKGSLRTIAVDSAGNRRVLTLPVEFIR